MMLSAAKVIAAFRRKTTSGDFIPEIDGLRFVCIALVVLLHIALSVSTREHLSTQSPLARWALQGGKGVSLFFVISGFVLALPFVKHRFLGTRPVALKAYYFRRVTRLEPPYIMAMTLVASAEVLGGKRIGLAHYLAGLAYLHGLIYGTHSPVIGAAWSLEVEIQFYLTMPILALVFLIPRRWPRRATIALAALAATTLQWAYIVPHSRLSLSLPYFIQFFLMGFLLADLYVNDWKQGPTRGAVWDAISFLGWPLMFEVWRGYRPGAVRPELLHALSFPFFTLLLFIAAFRGRLLTKFWRNAWITVVGGMCYSIYLLHVPIIVATGRLTTRLRIGAGFASNFGVQCLLLFPATIIISAVFFKLLERPCMDRRWPHRLVATLSALRPGHTRSVTPHREESG